MSEGTPPDRYAEKDAIAGIAAALVTLSVLLEHRGVLDKKEFADVLERIGPQLETGNATVFLNLLANAIRAAGLEGAPGGWKPISF